MPDELVAIASAGEFDEFDLNAFFEATGTGVLAQFKHKSDVQKWLDKYAPAYVKFQLQETLPAVMNNLSFQERQAKSQAPALYALADARVVAMEPAAIARVTGLDASKLVEDDPLLGQPVRHFAAWGGITRIVTTATLAAIGL